MAKTKSHCWKSVRYADGARMVDTPAADMVHTTLKLADYMIEVLQTADNAVKTVRIRPPPQQQPP